MASSLKEFTHVDNFTGYMKIVNSIVLKTGRPNLSILDVPAGNGLLADSFRKQGHQVTCADINSERKDYDYVNMEQKLPYKDETFDVVSCLEGIEHTINPNLLISELCRITKPNGFIILSMPNVQSFYSRLKFLFTGVFYGFEPEGPRHLKGRMIDRGHISSLSLVQLTYLFGESDFKPQYVTGDKIKKKILFPFYAILYIINVFSSLIRSLRTDDTDLKFLYKHLRSFRSLMSRSLIGVFGKSKIDNL